MEILERREERLNIKVRPSVLKAAQNAAHALSKPGEAVRITDIVELAVEDWVSRNIGAGGGMDAEDQEIVRIVRRPKDRAEKLVSETMKHYLDLLRKDREGKAD